MKNNLKININIKALLLVLIIIASIVRVVYVSQCVKEGYHSDETWSYGLANGYYNPFLHISGNVFERDFGKLQNVNKWISNQVIMDYISVQEGERFSYDSVWYNQSQDQLPPLYYAVLHTMCSFFPNQFSFWFGLIVNLLFLPFTIILMYKTGKILYRDDKTALIACAFYALGTGCLYTHLFIRMYAMTTFMVSLAVYISIRIINKSNADIKDMLLMALVTMCGGLTHYVFLFFMFFLTACNCIYLLLRKRFSFLLKYAASVLAGVGLIIAAFPTVLNQIAGRGGSRGGSMLQLPQRIVSAFVMNIMTREIVGVGTPIYKSVTGLYVAGAVLLGMIILGLLAYVMRNEAWMKNAIALLKLNIKKLWEEKRRLLNKENMFIIFLSIACAGEVFAVLATAYVIAMKNYSDRYLFCIYPIVCIIIVYVVNTLIKIIRMSGNIRANILTVCVFLVLCLCFRDCTYNNFYKFPSNKEGMGLDEIPEGSDVIVAFPIPWLMVTYPQYIKDCNQIYYWFINPHFEMDTSLKNIPDDGREVYLLYDNTYARIYENDEGYSDEIQIRNFFGMEIPDNLEIDSINTTNAQFAFSSKDVFEYLQNIDGVSMFEEVGSMQNYGRPVKIYRLR